ncbi:Tryptophan synthase alpha chain [Bienertia sinuspersici]
MDDQTVRTVAGEEDRLDRPPVDMEVESEWVFDGVEEDDQKVSLAIMVKIPLWVRIYDLPFKGRGNEPNARMIGNKNGPFICMDKGDNVDRSLRIRTLIDVNKPLVTKVKIETRAREKEEFAFRYKKLPLFCFICGMIGHGEECDAHRWDFSLKKNYGAWLKASHLRRGRGSGRQGGEEIEGCIRRLFVTKPVEKSKEDLENIRVVTQTLDVVHLQVVIKSFSARHIEADVGGDAINPKYRAVGVYGWPNMSQKQLTWELMRRLLVYCEVPVLVFGDFNEVLTQEEKSGGSRLRECYMEAFRATADGCALCDLGYLGNTYTWCRGLTPQTLVRERFDRFLASIRWCLMFPNMVVLNLPIQNSDHGPILLKENQGGRRDNGERLKKFESFWLSDVECKGVVEDTWRENSHLDVPKRVGEVLGRLNGWAKDTFGKLTGG